jgi:hypothetical protein
MPSARPAVLRPFLLARDRPPPRTCRLLSRPPEATLGCLVVSLAIIYVLTKLNARASWRLARRRGAALAATAALWRR